MVILEKIASHFLTFSKMNPIDKEKLKIDVETHYMLHKTKGKLHTFASLHTRGIGWQQTETSSLQEFAMFCQSTKKNSKAPLSR